jgi:hypothetical protein
VGIWPCELPMGRGRALASDRQDNTADVGPAWRCCGRDHYGRDPGRRGRNRVGQLKGAGHTGHWVVADPVGRGLGAASLAVTIRYNKGLATGPMALYILLINTGQSSPLLGDKKMSNLSLAISVKVIAGRKVYEADGDRAENEVYLSANEMGMDGDDFRALYAQAMVDQDADRNSPARDRWESLERRARSAALAGWAKPEEADVTLTAV